MPRCELCGPHNRTAMIAAPAGVSEREAMGFAQENWASWRDGGRYAMEPAGAEAPITPTAAQADVRRTEPLEAPGGRQKRAEADFNAAMHQWRTATGGALRP